MGHGRHGAVGGQSAGLGLSPELVAIPLLCGLRAKVTASTLL